MIDTLLLLAYISISVFGLFQVKVAEQLFSWQFALGIFAYGSGFLIWLGMLSRMPLSVAFPIAAGGLIAATQVVGYLFLKESMAIHHLLGVSLILSGVLLLLLRG